MGFDVEVTGGAELYQLRQRLKKVGATGLGKKMDAGFKRAVKPLQPAILAEVPKTMPSGYAPVLSKSLEHRLSSRTSQQSTQLRYLVYADGKSERRDIVALNRGLLRHPVFGRRRKAWVAQKVRAGFIDRPVDDTLPAVRREMNLVIQQAINELDG